MKSAPAARAAPCPRSAEDWNLLTLNAEEDDVNTPPNPEITAFLDLTAKRLDEALLAAVARFHQMRESNIWHLDAVARAQAETHSKVPSSTVLADGSEFETGVFDTEPRTVFAVALAEAVGVSWEYGEHLSCLIAHCKDVNAGVDFTPRSAVGRIRLSRAQRRAGLGVR